MIVAYLTHPLGESDTGDDLVRRSDNMANAIAWFRFLIMGTRWAVTMPWFVYVVGLPESTTQPRAMMDRLTILDRCNILILAGGRRSPHMDIEVRRAHVRTIPVLDLTDMGDVPPWNDYDKIRVEILRRAHEVGL